MSNYQKPPKLIQNFPAKNNNSAQKRKHITFKLTHKRLQVHYEFLIKFPLINIVVRVILYHNLDFSIIHGTVIIILLHGTVIILLLQYMYYCIRGWELKRETYLVNPVPTVIANQVVNRERAIPAPLAD